MNTPLSSIAFAPPVLPRGRARVPNPPRMPWVVYDGQCGFCKLWIRRWRRRLGDQVFFAPFQEAAALYPELPLARFERALQRIEPDGTVTEGAEAVFRTLAQQPLGQALAWLYRNVPGAAWSTELAYRWVANHRSTLYSPTRWLLDPSPEEARSRRWLPLAVGTVALAATGALAWRLLRRR
jgi:predicted DCC family thiol-disulfide oxidoreductase YuxK